MENIHIAFLLEYSSVGFFNFKKDTNSLPSHCTESHLWLILFTCCCRERGPNSDVLHKHYPNVLERFAVMTNGFL